jgi:NAD(P)-dependent dehydrogenase (short-subunit alcohol dehydrogenase family)
MDISLKVMTIGATNGAMHALERMRKSNGGDGGRIITTASCAGIVVRC